MEMSVCDSDSSLDYKGHRGNSLLHYAAQNGNVDLMRYVIEMGSSVKDTNDLGETALHAAATVYFEGKLSKSKK
jgi:ankyrin repeat protein